MAQIIKYSQVQREEQVPDVLISEPHALAFSEEHLSDLKKLAYDEGYSQGQVDATDIAHEQVNALKQRLEQALHSIPQAIEQNRQEMQQELTSLCLLIAQRYFIAQSIEPKILETQINQLLAQINNQQAIELHLHPKDIPLLQQGLVTLNAAQHKITIKPDESLTLGGFIIKTPHGLFDARLDKQIDKFKQYLMSLRQEEQS